MNDPFFSLTVPEQFKSFRSFVDIVRWRAQEQTDLTAFTYLVDGEQVEDNITFGELDRQAQRLAARIRRMADAGDRALLVYESGLPYIVALLGCFYAGVIAVPVYPPDPMRAKRTLDRLQTILEDSQAKLLLTTHELLHFTDPLMEQCHHLKQVMATDRSGAGEGAAGNGDEPFIEENIFRDSIALLQYTSGSTGTPKGVMVTHGNLLFNSRHIQQFDEPNAVAVSWLPMYHDMGLMGMVLQALHSGRRLVIMSPLAFVARPYRWLQAVSKYRAYATSGPNFGYELCTRKITDEELATLDLSCLTLACNGAEPVRIQTLDRFANRFAACGFDRKAFYPCYGLAEATLIVSGGAKYEAPVVQQFDAQLLTQGQVARGGACSGSPRALIGCGPPVSETDVRIVNPDTGTLCLDDQIGEIWVSGPGVGSGYWNNPQATKTTFQAYLADTAEGPFLRTGDLGFFDQNELFITGRKKDVIIVRGRNHYPQDVERTVETTHACLRTDCGAAFPVDVNGQEQLVIVHEVTRYRRVDLDALLQDLRARIVREHELFPHAIVLIRGGSISKTTSGKIQRRDCKQRFEENRLDIIARWDAEGGAQQQELDAERLAVGSQRLSVHAATVTPPPNGKHVDKIVPRQSGKRGVPPSEDQIFEDLRALLRTFNERCETVTLSRKTCLFADLGLVSIDAVMLQADIENHYQRRFAFRDFIAEIGQRDVPDISLGDLVDFLAREFAAGALFTEVAPSHLTARGLKFYYRQEGTGPDVVLIHGVAGNMAVWYLCGLVKQLARRFRVTVYDLRGHGHSQRTDTGYTSNDMAEDLHAIQCELGIRQPYYLGHSFGAAIAMQMAVKYRDDVAGVVLSDAYFPGLADVQGEPGRWPGWTAYKAMAGYIGIEVSDEWDNLADLFQQVANLRGEQRQRFIEIAGEPTYQRLLQIANTSCGHDVADPAGLTKERILSIKHPVVCLYGQQSPFQPLCQFLVDNLPNCETAIVPDAEHFAFEENPADFVRLANEKISQLAGFAASDTIVDLDPHRARRQQTLFTKQ